MVCSKDKEQDKLKGPILLEQTVTGLLSLCHDVTIAMNQSPPPKQHALSFSHPYKERHLPRFSPAQHTESIYTLPSQQMTCRFPGYKNRQATQAHCRPSLATRKSARRKVLAATLLFNKLYLLPCVWKFFSNPHLDHDNLNSSHLAPEPISFTMMRYT